MTARGFVEGRRESTPDAKFCDKELAAEDRAARAKIARACKLGDSLLVKTAQFELKYFSIEKLDARARMLCIVGNLLSADPRGIASI
jgi:hypothetical protein